jgi:cytochrome c peroxidase
MQLKLARYFTSAIIALGAGVTEPARATATVGETSHVELPARLTPAKDQLKTEFLRPDAIPFPSTNPYTAEKVMLGQVLYHDTRLSGNGAQACASCHNAGFGYGDGQKKAVGASMKLLERRSPSLINAAWGDLYMWDGSARSLEEQALRPIQSKNEMNEPMADLIRKLGAIQEYGPLFAAAFPDQPIAPATIANAIATYERTVVSTQAPFDAWIEGDDSAISASAKIGFILFNTKAQCELCHSGWRFTDDGFHDIGLPDDDIGRGRLLPHIKKMQHAFKTPGLREIARRGPYMHDGSLATLEDVVAHYNSGGADRPSRSELVTKLRLSLEEQSDIAAFLRTLTSPVAPDLVPILPR